MNPVSCDAGVMKRRASHTSLLLIATFIAISPVLFAQSTSNVYRVIENRVRVDASVDKAWAALADFSGVSGFHVLFDESNLLKGEKRLAVGNERESHIPDGINNVILKERITEMKEGSFYSYTVYDWENIPLESMSVTYGVGVNPRGETEIYNRTVYRMTSGVITGLARGKFEKGSKDSLISYKYFIETGKNQKDLKALRKWFKRKEKDNGTDELLADSDHRDD